MKFSKYQLKNRDALKKKARKLYKQGLTMDKLLHLSERADNGYVVQSMDVWITQFDKM